MAMTWAMLHERLSKMDAVTALTQDATVFLKETGEVFAIEDIGTVETLDQNGDVSGVLDDGHFVLQVNA